MKKSNAFISYVRKKITEDFYYSLKEISDLPAQLKNFESILLAFGATYTLLKS